MRDRMEQQIAMSVAMQQSYTEVADSHISVSPGTYFAQPTTFITNRNSGEDIVISFEDYSSPDNQGKVYHIKNMGLTPAIVVSSAGALFDGQSTITLPQYASVSIMSLNLPEGSNTASMWTILCSKGKAADDILKMLTLEVNGLPANIEVSVNDVVWPNRQKSFAEGTVLQNLMVTAIGYSITPTNIPSVTMDADKTLTFEAVEMGDDPILSIVVNGIPETYEVVANGIVWPGKQKSFPFGTVLENLVVTVEGYDINPPVVEQVVLDGNKTLTFTGQGIISDDILLDGATRIVLNPTIFTKTGNTYVGNVSEVSTTMSERMMGNGYFALRYELDQGCTVYLLQDTSWSGYVGFYAYDGLIYVDNNGAQTQITVPDVHQYYALRRVGGVLGLYSTNDGVSFTLLHNIGTIGYTYISYSAIGTNIVYDPQVLGVTT
ncbi:hypothetical protein [Pedobacter nyackensis]|nr:hypothetical protein [Pedobacter nyackensis]